MLFKSIPLTAVASVTALFALTALPLGASAQTRPALTRDVDRPSAQPVNGTCETFREGGSGYRCILYKVPVGKRLVVELISYSLQVPSATLMYQMVAGRHDPSPKIFEGVGRQLYAVNLTQPSVIGGGLGLFKNYSGSQSMTFYLEETEELAVGVRDDGTAVIFQQKFSFSGYLVDK